MTNPKETASQRRMREFREAQEQIAVGRHRARGGDDEHRSIPLGEGTGRPQE